MKKLKILKLSPDSRCLQKLALKVHYYKEKVGISKFQVAHFIFACLSLPNTKLTVFVCCPSVAV